MTPDETNQATPWQLRPGVGPISLITFLECVMETAYALEEFIQIARQDTPYVTPMVAKTRQISVALRKLLLEGNGSLLKRCIEKPEMHPVRAPAPNAKTLRATTSFKKQNYLINFADGSSSNLNIPEFEHFVAVHPLYGIEHESENRTILTSPFDFTAKTVRFNKWMNTELLEINSMQFDTMSILHLMAINEGAHTNESVPFVGPVLLNEDNKVRYSAIDGIKFGVLSYMQIFTLFTGSYLVNRVRETIDSIGSRTDESRVKEMCDLIQMYPRDFPLRFNTSISIAANPLHVLGKAGELVGDYTQGVTTTMRIPRA